MILITQPPNWNSAHRPIEWLYDHEERNIMGSSDVSGNLRISTDFVFDFVPVAGSKILIEGAGLDDYNTIHTVLSVSGLFITLETDYVGSIGGAPTAKFIRLPQIKLYSGYLSGEEYDTELPITLVATFTPENSPDNNVQIDVSAYLQSIFRIVAPVEGIDFNMFNRFRLYFDGTYKEVHNVINSAIKTADLNALYVDTDRWLNSIPALVFNCGETILSKVQGNVVVNLFDDDGEMIGASGDFSDDFTDDFSRINN